MSEINEKVVQIVGGIKGRIQNTFRRPETREIFDKAGEAAAAGGTLVIDSIDPATGARNVSRFTGDKEKKTQRFKKL